MGRRQWFMDFWAANGKEHRDRSIPVDIVHGENNITVHTMPPGVNPDCIYVSSDDGGVSIKAVCKVYEDSKYGDYLSCGSATAVSTSSAKITMTGAACGLLSDRQADATIR